MQATKREWLHLPFVGVSTLQEQQRVLNTTKLTEMNLLGFIVLLILLHFAYKAFRKILRWSISEAGDIPVSRAYQRKLSGKKNSSADDQRCYGEEFGSKQKGDDFEAYVVNLFSTKTGRFRLKEWRSDKIAANGMYAESSHKPDLEIAFVNGTMEHRFAIECKWRQQFHHGAIQWAKDYQISNYVKYQRANRIPVFVAIGVGGTPSYPDALYLAPLEDIAPYPSVSSSFLQCYYRDPQHKFYFNPYEKLLC
jgi:hypothetical protein